MPQNPTDTAQTIIQSAIRCFLRYGARKTSMNDVAKAADVSRQTVYDLFGNKDDLICASIRFVTDAGLAEIKAQTENAPTLSHRLSIYFAESVVKNFEMMQESDDPQDLITGHSVAGKAEIAASRTKHESLIADWLEPHTLAISTNGHSVRSLAHYIVVVSMAFKYEASDRRDLDMLLASLKRMIMQATVLQERTTAAE